MLQLGHWNRSQLRPTGLSDNLQVLEQPVADSSDGFAAGKSAETTDPNSISVTEALAEPDSTANVLLWQTSWTT